MWVVSFSCLTGLQNLEKNYSLASQIYQVLYLHKAYYVYLLWSCFILLFHGWLFCILIFFFSFFFFRKFKTGKEKLWELANDATASGGNSVFQCSCTAYFFGPF